MGVETKRTTTSRPPNRGPARGPGRASDHEEFLAALETVSHGVRDPVAKLKFLRS